jgi:hypothetical protein
VYDCVLGSRILGTGQIASGMPTYKYIANRCLTAFQNLLSQHKLSEYHTGYRAFSRRVLESLPLHRNSDDFVFDNEMLAQIICGGFRIGELSCPAKYDERSSSIHFWRSVWYGFGVLRCSVATFCALHGLGKARIFKADTEWAHRLPLTEVELVRVPRGYRDRSA